MCQNNLNQVSASRHTLVTSHESQLTCYDVHMYILHKIQQANANGGVHLPEGEGAGVQVNIK
jgi:hypothetical protein